MIVNQYLFPYAELFATMSLKVLSVSTLQARDMNHVHFNLFIRCFPIIPVITSGAS